MTAPVLGGLGKLASPLQMAYVVVAGTIALAVASLLSPFAVGTVLISACAVGVAAGYSTSGSV